MQKVAKRMEAAGQDKVVGGSEKSKILPCLGWLLPHTFFKGKKPSKDYHSTIFLPHTEIRLSLCYYLL